VIDNCGNGKDHDMDSITIPMPRQIKSRLDKISKKDHQNTGEIVLDAIRKYIFRRDVDELRERMIPRAQKMGVYTDEDVFKLVS
jgi:metal-responsive CopG/Arc/MetJ family transcriptional regulator